MIHGLLYRKPNPHRFEKNLDEQSLKLSPAHETITTWASPNCWLVQSSDENAPLLGQDSPLQITAWARLDNELRSNVVYGIRRPSCLIAHLFVPHL